MALYDTKPKCNPKKKQNLAYNCLLNELERLSAHISRTARDSISYIIAIYQR